MWMEVYSLKHLFYCQDNKYEKMRKALIKDNATPLHTLPPFQLRCNLKVLQRAEWRRLLLRAQPVLHTSIMCSAAGRMCTGEFLAFSWRGRVATRWPLKCVWGHTDGREWEGATVMEPNAPAAAGQDQLCQPEIITVTHCQACTCLHVCPGVCVLAGLCV